MISSFWGCQRGGPADPTPVQKGIYLADPIFKGSAVKLINIPENKYDQDLAKLTAIERPKDLISYETIQTETRINTQRITIIELISSTPASFKWGKTGYRFVAVGVFVNPVRVKNNEIDNKEDIVWLWTTNNAPDPGEIKYGSGNGVKYNNDQFTLGPPPPLSRTKLYVWCVWAWDDEGKNIIASSRELPIKVQ